MIRSILLSLTLFLAALAIQDPPAPPTRDIPQCQGKECEGGHDGQPSWCANYNANGYRKNCDCKRDCEDVDQDMHRESGCATYCRTPRCRCEHGCPRTK